MRRAFLVPLLLAAALPVAAARPCMARTTEGPSASAGIVVQLSDIDVREFCVAVEGRVTALDLVQRTGLRVETGSSLGGDNVPICRIEDVGCAQPKHDCFCRCTGSGECTFWGYYRIARGDTRWRFLDTGPGVTVVLPGEVHGFRWAVQSTKGGGAPSATDHAGVCRRGIAVSAGARAPLPPFEPGSPWPAVAVVAAVLVGLTFLALRVRRARGEAA